LRSRPEWVCEILSPATARDDRVVKMPIYARAGVGHIWLIDPDLRALESGRWVLLESHRDDAQVAPPPFGAIEIGLGDLWA
jgi:Uma2 family endonuclease